MSGKEYRPGPVPASFVILDLAKSWGVPPWVVVSGNPPSDDERRRWLVRAMIRRSLGV